MKPETQDLASYVDGIDNVYEAQQRVAQLYFQDGSIDDACPPLKALLYIMAEGQFGGKTISDPAIRFMFTREYLLESDWYQQRLEIKQQRDSKLWQQNKAYIQQQLAKTEQNDVSIRAMLMQKLEVAERMLVEINNPAYLKHLHGTLGADWVRH